MTSMQMDEWSFWYGYSVGTLVSAIAVLVIRRLKLLKSHTK